MKSMLLSGAFAVAMIGAFVLPSGAAVIPITPVSTPPGLTIPLGSTSFQTIVIPGPAASTFDDFFNFNPSVNGTFSANAVEGTSAGSNVINPFSIGLFRVGVAIPLAFSNVIDVVGNTEEVTLSNVPLLSGVNYYVEVQGSAFAHPNPIDVDGNVTLFATPLPGALPLFGSVMLGLWGWARMRRSTATA